MSPENQPMIDALCLTIIQWRQLGERRGFGFTQDALGHSLQRAPARPIQIGRMGDLPHEAAPLNNDPVNVSRAEQVGYPGMFIERILVDRRNDGLRPRAVFRRQTVFEITGDALQLKLLWTNWPLRPRPTLSNFVFAISKIPTRLR